MKRRIVLMLGLLTWAGALLAAEPEPLKPGTPAPTWSALPGTDGKNHSLSDHADKKAVLVVFFANHCPDCEGYLDRVLAISKDYKEKGVATVLISVSRMEEDTLEHMIQLAREKKFDCDYLKDESQAIGKQFGAGSTPEVFLLDGDRKVAYHGAVDDHWKPAKVTRPHVRIALDEILAGKPVSMPETEAQGCFIEYEDE